MARRNNGNMYKRAALSLIASVVVLAIGSVGGILWAAQEDRGKIREEISEVSERTGKLETLQPVILELVRGMDKKLDRALERP